MVRSVDEPPCWLISGIPGAGKTTIAHALAERLLSSAHIEGDKIGHDFIVSGLVPPDAEPQREAERQLDLRRLNIRQLADSFAIAGFTPVIDDVIVSEEVLDGYRLLATRPIAFVQLVPTSDTVLARDASREKQVAATWVHLDDQVRSWPEPRPALWLDSSELTVEATVEAIVQRSDQAILPW